MHLFGSNNISQRLLSIFHIEVTHEYDVLFLFSWQKNLYLTCFHKNIIRDHYFIILQQIQVSKLHTQYIHISDLDTAKIATAKFFFATYTLIIQA